MKVIFFKVEDILNFNGSDAVAPSGRKGIAESRVKELKKLVSESGARLVLFGEWRKDWDFDDSKCTKDGIYLNKKLERKGLHILDKIKDEMTDNDGVMDWVHRHPNVTDSLILEDINNINWIEW